MPKLLSRSKHEELESNSELQIRDQKERGAENARKEEQKMQGKRSIKLKKKGSSGILPDCENFATCRMSQVALFILPATIHISVTVPSRCLFLLFDFLCYIFCFLPILSLVISFDFGSFCNFAWLG